MNTKTLFVRSAFGLILLLAAACGPQQAEIETPEPAQIANPASVHCLEQGGRSEIRTAADGSQYGVCIFPDGGECEEWDYFQGECSPETAAQAGRIFLPSLPSAGEGQDFETRFADVAGRMLAEQLGVDPSVIVYDGLDQTVWPDACLGLPEPDEMCAQVETPGYLLILTVDGVSYRFRSNLDGSEIRQEGG
jgi:uncharacterized protein